MSIAQEIDDFDIAVLAPDPNKTRNLLQLILALKSAKR